MLSAVFKVCRSSQFLNSLYTRNPKWVLLKNSEDPDEMLHSAAFHQGLHCLLRKNDLQTLNIIFLKL